MASITRPSFVETALGVGGRGCLREGPDARPAVHGPGHNLQHARVRLPLAHLPACTRVCWVRARGRDERYGTREAIELLAVCLVLKFVD